MKCSHCHQEIEQGAAFCGNCGQPVAGAAPAAAPQPPAQPAATTPAVVPAPAPVTPAPVATAAAPAATAAVPAYSVPVANHGGGKAVASMVLGIIGLIGWIVPIVGFVLAITGFVLGTLSLKSSRKGFAIAGIVLTVITMLLSLGAFVYNIQHYDDAKAQSYSNSLKAVQNASNAVVDAATAGISN